MQPWSPSSWTRFSYSQRVEYPDSTALALVLEKLKQLPALVSPLHIRHLKQSISDAQHNKVFLLQGGDCAESFQDCHLASVTKKLKIMHEMSLLLSKSLHKPVIQIGRIAGQYAKARSDDFETQQHITLPSYRGDLINDADFSLKARTPDPQRLLEGYHASAKTLQMIETLRYNSQTFFTSHEALHLPYEQALTHFDSTTQQWYLLSTHLPWIGVRTNALDSAHLELMRGIANPIGIKVGPHATPEWLYQVLTRLNPHQEPGRILLITRLGADTLFDCLPPLIQLIKKENLSVTWSCDPMHGNTILTERGIKTRVFETILKELKQTLLLHQQYDSHLGGVHLELAGENVTECIGGARGIQEKDLIHAYHSLVDPRLNYEQSLEIALQLGTEARAKLKNHLDDMKDSSVEQLL